ncbi:MAG: cobyrinate a,c-diamide synthase [Geminicoccaceae bacterium]|nr:cobyrinate a,c-diamide synthase [Geminicoccaceae bacterium]
MSAPAIIVSGCSRRCGKTGITMALSRLVARRGRRVRALGIGTDRAAAGHLASATGYPCPTIDGWSMRLETLASVMRTAGADADLLLLDGSGALFDGLPKALPASRGETGGGARGVTQGPFADQEGSAADVAALLGLPVLLVVDAAGQDVSAAAVVDGFLRARDDVGIVGLILVNVTGAQQSARLHRSFEARFSLAVLGQVEQAEARMLDVAAIGPPGAGNRLRVEAEIAAIEAALADRLDVERLMRLARPATLDIMAGPAVPLAPIGQRIALADDDAFSFRLPSVVDGWRATGAEILPFSPLADEAPPKHADAVYLPDGPCGFYLERLATNRGFVKGLHAAAARDTFVYAEGGGFLSLAEAAIDTTGRSHAMAGLLPVRLEARGAMQAGSLGMVEVRARATTPLARRGLRCRGHLTAAGRMVERRGAALFEACGDGGAEFGAIAGTVCGSFVQLIDRAPHLGVVRS